MIKYLFLILGSVVVENTAFFTTNTALELPAKNNPVLMRLLQTVDAATTDERLLDVSLQLLKSLCLCMRETLNTKQLESSLFSGDTNSLQAEDDTKDPSKKVLELYQNIYNKTCYDLKNEVASKVNKSANISSDEEKDFILRSDCGKTPIHDGTHNHETQNQVTGTNKDDARLEDILYQTFIKTRNYHRFRARKYSLYKATEKQKRVPAKHNIIVILTFYPSNDSSPSITNCTKLTDQLNNTLLTHSPIDIDIIDARFGQKENISDESLMPKEATDCTLKSIYTFLLQSERNNRTKVFKLMRRSNTIKVYIDVTSGTNHSDYTKTCCTNRTDVSLCKIEFSNESFDSKEITTYPSTVDKSNNFKKTISKIKSLVKLYDKKLKKKKLRRLTTTQPSVKQNMVTNNSMTEDKTKFEKAEKGEMKMSKSVSTSTFLINDAGSKELWMNSIANDKSSHEKYKIHNTDISLPISHVHKATVPLKISTEKDNQNKNEEATALHSKLFRSSFKLPNKASAKQLLPTGPLNVQENWNNNVEQPLSETSRYGLQMTGTSDFIHSITGPTTSYNKTASSIIYNDSRQLTPNKHKSENINLSYGNKDIITTIVDLPPENTLEIVVTANDKQKKLMFDEFFAEPNLKDMNKNKTSDVAITNEDNILKTSKDPFFKSPFFSICISLSKKTQHTELSSEKSANNIKPSTYDDTIAHENVSQITYSNISFDVNSLTALRFTPSISNDGSQHDKINEISSLATEPWVTNITVRNISTQKSKINNTPPSTSSKDNSIDNDTNQFILKSNFTMHTATATLKSYDMISHSIYDTQDGNRLTNHSAGFESLKEANNDLKKTVKTTKLAKKDPNSTLTVKEPTNYGDTSTVETAYIDTIGKSITIDGSQTETEHSFSIIYQSTEIYPNGLEKTNESKNYKISSDGTEARLPKNETNHLIDTLNVSRIVLDQQQDIIFSDTEKENKYFEALNSTRTKGFSYPYVTDSTKSFKFITDLDDDKYKVTENFNTNDATEIPANIIQSSISVNFKNIQESNVTTNDDTLPEFTYSKLSGVGDYVTFPDLFENMIKKDEYLKDNRNEFIKKKDEINYDQPANHFNISEISTVKHRCTSESEVDGGSTFSNTLPEIKKIIINNSNPKISSELYLGLKKLNDANIHLQDDDSAKESTVILTINKNTPVARNREKKFNKIKFSPRSSLTQIISQDKTTYSLNHIEYKTDKKFVPSSSTLDILELFNTTKELAGIVVPTNANFAVSGIKRDSENGIILSANPERPRSINKSTIMHVFDANDSNHDDSKDILYTTKPYVQEQTKNITITIQRIHENDDLSKPTRNNDTRPITRVPLSISDAKTNVLNDSLIDEFSFNPQLNEIFENIPTTNQCSNSQRPHVSYKDDNFSISKSSKDGILMIAVANHVNDSKNVDINFSYTSKSISHEDNENKSNNINLNLTPDIFMTNTNVKSKIPVTTEHTIETLNSALNNALDTKSNNHVESKEISDSTMSNLFNQIGNKAVFKGNIFTINKDRTPTTSVDQSTYGPQIDTIKYLLADYMDKSSQVYEIFDNITHTYTNSQSENNGVTTMDTNFNILKPVTNEIPMIIAPTVDGLKSDALNYHESENTLDKINYNVFNTSLDNDELSKGIFHSTIPYLYNQNEETSTVVLKKNINFTNTDTKTTISDARGRIVPGDDGVKYPHSDAIDINSQVYKIFDNTSHTTNQDPSNQNTDNTDTSIISNQNILKTNMEVIPIIVAANINDPKTDALNHHESKSTLDTINSNFDNVFNTSFNNVDLSKVILDSTLPYLYNQNEEPSMVVLKDNINFTKKDTVTKISDTPGSIDQEDDAVKYPHTDATDVNSQVNGIFDNISHTTNQDISNRNADITFTSTKTNNNTLKTSMDKIPSIFVPTVNDSKTEALNYHKSESTLDKINPTFVNVFNTSFNSIALSKEILHSTIPYFYNQNEETSTVVFKDNINFTKIDTLTTISDTQHSIGPEVDTVKYSHTDVINANSQVYKIFENISHITNQDTNNKNAEDTVASTKNNNNIIKPSADEIPIIIAKTVNDSETEDPNNNLLESTLDTINSNLYNVLNASFNNIDLSNKMLSSTMPYFYNQNEETSTVVLKDYINFTKKDTVTKITDTPGSIDPEDDAVKYPHTDATDLNSQVDGIFDNISHTTNQDTNNQYADNTVMSTKTNNNTLKPSMDEILSIVVPTVNDSKTKALHHHISESTLDKTNPTFVNVFNTSFNNIDLSKKKIDSTIPYLYNQNEDTSMVLFKDNINFTKKDTLTTISDTQGSIDPEVGNIKYSHTDAIEANSQVYKIFENISHTTNQDTNNQNAEDTVASSKTNYNIIKPSADEIPIIVAPTVNDSETEALNHNKSEITLIKINPAFVNVFNTGFNNIDLSKTILDSAKPYLHNQNKKTSTVALKDNIDMTKKDTITKTSDAQGSIGLKTAAVKYPHSDATDINSHVYEICDNTSHTINQDPSNQKTNNIDTSIITNQNILKPGMEEIPIIVAANINDHTTDALNHYVSKSTLDTINSNFDNVLNTSFNNVDLSKEILGSTIPYFYNQNLETSTVVLNGNINFTKKDTVATISDTPGSIDPEDNAVKYPHTDAITVNSQVYGIFDSKSHTTNQDTSNQNADNTVTSYKTNKNTLKPSIDEIPSIVAPTVNYSKTDALNHHKSENTLDKINPTFVNVFNTSFNNIDLSKEILDSTIPYLYNQNEETSTIVLKHNFNITKKDTVTTINDARSSFVPVGDAFNYAHSDVIDKNSQVYEVHITNNDPKSQNANKANESDFNSLKTNNSMIPIIVSPGHNSKNKVQNRFNIFDSNSSLTTQLNPHSSVANNTEDINFLLITDQINENTSNENKINVIQESTLDTTNFAFGDVNNINSNNRNLSNEISESTKQYLNDNSENVLKYNISTTTTDTSPITSGPQSSNDPEVKKLNYSLTEATDINSQVNEIFDNLSHTTNNYPNSQSEDNILKFNEKDFNILTTNKDEILMVTRPTVNDFKAETLNYSEFFDMSSSYTTKSHPRSKQGKKTDDMQILLTSGRIHVSPESTIDTNNSAFIGEFSTHHNNIDVSKQISDNTIRFSTDAFKYITSNKDTTPFNTTKYLLTDAIDMHSQVYEISDNISHTTNQYPSSQSEDKVISYKESNYNIFSDKMSVLPEITQDAVNFGLDFYTNFNNIHKSKEKLHMIPLYENTSVHLFRLDNLNIFSANNSWKPIKSVTKSVFDSNVDTFNNASYSINQYSNGQAEYTTKDNNRLLTAKFDTPISNTGVQTENQFNVPLIKTVVPFKSSFTDIYQWHNISQSTKLLEDGNNETTATVLLNDGYVMTNPATVAQIVNDSKVNASNSGLTEVFDVKSEVHGLPDKIFFTTETFAQSQSHAKTGKTYDLFRSDGFKSQEINSFNNEISNIAAPFNDLLLPSMLSKIKKIFKNEHKLNFSSEKMLKTTPSSTFEMHFNAYFNVSKEMLLSTLIPMHDQNKNTTTVPHGNNDLYIFETNTDRTQKMSVAQTVGVIDNQKYLHSNVFDTTASYTTEPYHYSQRQNITDDILFTVAQLNGSKPNKLNTQSFGIIQSNIESEISNATKTTPESMNHTVKPYSLPTNSTDPPTHYLHDQNEGIAVIESQNNSYNVSSIPSDINFTTNIVEPNNLSILDAPKYSHTDIFDKNLPGKVLVTTTQQLHTTSTHTTHIHTPTHINTHDWYTSSYSSINNDIKTFTTPPIYEVTTRSKDDSKILNKSVDSDERPTASESTEVINELDMISKSSSENLVPMYTKEVYDMSYQPHEFTQNMSHVTKRYPYDIKVPVTYDSNRPEAYLASITSNNTSNSKSAVSNVTLQNIIGFTSTMMDEMQVSTDKISNESLDLTSHIHYAQDILTSNDSLLASMIKPLRNLPTPYTNKPNAYSAKKITEKSDIILNSYDINKNSTDAKQVEVAADRTGPDNNLVVFSMLDKDQESVNNDTGIDYISTKRYKFQSIHPENDSQSYLQTPNGHFTSIHDNISDINQFPSITPITTSFPVTRNIKYVTELNHSTINNDITSKPLFMKYSSDISVDNTNPYSTNAIKHYTDVMKVEAKVTKSPSMIASIPPTYDYLIVSNMVDDTNDMIDINDNLNTLETITKNIFTDDLSEHISSGTPSIFPDQEKSFNLSREHKVSKTDIPREVLPTNNLITDVPKITNNFKDTTEYVFYDIPFTIKNNIQEMRYISDNNNGSYISNENTSIMRDISDQNTPILATPNKKNIEINFVDEEEVMKTDGFGGEQEKMDRTTNTNEHYRDTIPTPANISQSQLTFADITRTSNSLVGSNMAGKGKETILDDFNLNGMTVSATESAKPLLADVSYDQTSLGTAPYYSDQNSTDNNKTQITNKIITYKDDILKMQTTNSVKLVSNMLKKVMVKNDLNMNILPIKSNDTDNYSVISDNSFNLSRSTSPYSPNQQKDKIIYLKDELNISSDLKAPSDVSAKSTQFKKRISRFTLPNPRPSAGNNNGDRRTKTVTEKITLMTKALDLNRTKLFSSDNNILNTIKSQTSIETEQYNPIKLSVDIKYKNGVTSSDNNNMLSNYLSEAHTYNKKHFKSGNKTGKKAYLVTESSKEINNVNTNYKNHTITNIPFNKNLFKEYFVEPGITKSNIDSDSENEIELDYIIKTKPLNITVFKNKTATDSVTNRQYMDQVNTTINHINLTSLSRERDFLVPKMAPATDAKIINDVPNLIEKKLLDNNAIRLSDTIDTLTINETAVSNATNKFPIYNFDINSTTVKITLKQTLKDINNTKYGVNINPNYNTNVNIDLITARVPKITNSYIEQTNNNRINKKTAKISLFTENIDQETRHSIIIPINIKININNSNITRVHNSKNQNLTTLNVPTTIKKKNKNIVHELVTSSSIITHNFGIKQQNSDDDDTTTTFNPIDNTHSRRTFISKAKYFESIAAGSDKNNVKKAEVNTLINLNVTSKPDIKPSKSIVYNTYKALTEEELTLPPDVRKIITTFSTIYTKEINSSYQIAKLKNTKQIKSDSKSKLSVGNNTKKIKKSKVFNVLKENVYVDAFINDTLQLNRRTYLHPIENLPIKIQRKSFKRIQLKNREGSIMAMNTNDFLSFRRAATIRDSVHEILRPQPMPVLKHQVKVSNIAKVPRRLILRPMFNSFEDFKKNPVVKPIIPKNIIMPNDNDFYRSSFQNHHKPIQSWKEKIDDVRTKLEPQRRSGPTAPAQRRDFEPVIDVPYYMPALMKPYFLRDKVESVRSYIYNEEKSPVNTRKHFKSPPRVETSGAVVDALDSQEHVYYSAGASREDVTELSSPRVTDYWLEDMYLKVRLPLPINSNPGMVFPLRRFAKVDEVADLAALFIDDLLDYKEMLDRGELPLERATSREKGQPLCMEQFYRLLGVCRVPQLGKDRLELPPLRPEGEQEELVVVACRNYLYPIPVKAADRGRLTPGEIQAQLLMVMVEAASAPAAPRVGLLSALPRDAWARARDILCEDETNRHNMGLISRALCIVCLDEAGGDRADADADTNSLLRAMHGAGTKHHSANRWFDKTVQLIISSDGTVGMCYEHSAAEGVAVVRLAERALARAAVAARPDPPPVLLPAPQAMRWTLPTDVERMIEQAGREIDRNIADLDLKVYTYRGYGREFMKSCRTSPDVYIQLAMQYAYLKMYGNLVSTYESASLRRFLQGRVDNIRSAHVPAQAWAKAMCVDETPPRSEAEDSQKKDQKKLELFEEAAKKQTTIMEANILGRGIDNHLLALRETARAQGPLPELFTDPTYKQMNEFKLSTSQVATTTDGTFMGYGAVVPDGYGCSYNPKKDCVIFCISSFASSSVTNTEAFRQSLEEALDSMKLMFQHRQTE